MTGKQMLLEEKCSFLKKTIDRSLEKKRFVEITIKKRREELKEIEVLLEKMQTAPIYLNRR